MKYRVNFGQGQVTNSFEGSTETAEKELAKVRSWDGCGATFLQRYEGDGEWSNLQSNGEWLLAL